MEVAMSRVGLMLCCLAFVGATLAADNTYLASYERDLLRRAPDGTWESFDLNERIFSLLTDTDTNTVYAYGNTDGTQRLFTLDNAVAGTPTLQTVCTLTKHYGSLALIDGLFYGVNDVGLWTIDAGDPANPVETLIGATGISYTGGMAYDQATDTLYMAAFNDNVYTLDRATGTPTLVGDLGINVISIGMEWWEGQLWMAAQNATSGQYEIGLVDPATGVYTAQFAAPHAAANVATALTIVPEPASLLLMTLAIALRRR
jgi:hypothetical protein